MILIGYSGHAFVVCGILYSAGKKVTAYCDSEEKANNPFGLKYLGPENAPEALAALKENDCFISVGDNKIRRKISENLKVQGISPINAIHASAIIDSSALIGASSIMISAGTILNSLCVIKNGVIINTGAIIEHECIVKDFAHVGPGAVLCGNVSIGENTFVGAGSVVRQGIKIGSNVMIGAGSVVVKNVPDGGMVMGNPAKVH